MASNNLASIAAATAAGWKLERYTRPNGTFVTSLKLPIVGQPGNNGREQVTDGESVTSSAAADTVALANCNAWRANRYGSDSAGQNVSTVQNPAASPSTQGVTPVHATLTKDKH
jgi:hypothetical protein